MTLAASGQGGLLVRLGPESSAEVLRKPHASMAVMRGREMPGWIRVASAGVRTKRKLAPWVRRSLAFVHAARRVDEPGSLWLSRALCR
jgi:hypothetical protein